MNKSSNIIRWVVFGLLALISITCMVLFYMNQAKIIGERPVDPSTGAVLEDQPRLVETSEWKDWFDRGRVDKEPNTPLTDFLLNWSYVKVFLGIAIAVVAFIIMGVIKGINWKTILIVFGAIAVIGVISYVLAKPFFALEYKADAATYSGTTHGLVEMGMNFFLITFIIALVAILFSVIYKAIKR